jgi:DNA-binding response OmpR family regulator
VEDDEEVAAVLARLLGNGGIACEVAASLADLRSSKRPACDLVLLDLSLPDGDGFDVLRDVRRVSDVPVVVLSGRTGEVDRVRAFDAGANDYVVKPFLPQELLARIRYQLRSARRPRMIGPLRIDSGAYTAYVDDDPVALTPREFDLLLYLVERRHRVCHRDEILRAIWRTEFTDPGVLNEYVYRLRSRLKDAGLPDPIRTRRGLGYQFVLPEDASA